MLFYDGSCNYTSGTYRKSRVERLSTDEAQLSTTKSQTPPDLVVKFNMLILLMLFYDWSCDRASCINGKSRVELSSPSEAICLPLNPGECGIYGPATAFRAGVCGLYAGPHHGWAAPYEPSLHDV